jgi:PHD/YefM family antitoxin component YafN of YafNO toxin-antitoxin module
MATKTAKTAPEVVLRNGKPVGVILDIVAYEKLLERLDDADDLRALAALKKRAPRFRKWEDVRAGLLAPTRSSSNAPRELS